MAILGGETMIGAKRMGRLMLVMAVAVTPALWAQKRDQLVEMQRDLGLLQDQLKTMERTQAERLAAIEKLVTQAIENQGKIATVVGGLEAAMSAQQKALIAPVATIGSKVDELSTEMGGFKETLREVNSQMRKIQAQMVDLNNAVKIMQAPPAAPPQDPNAPPPGMTSEAVYQEAMRAKSSGQFDLAEQRFTEFLRFYGSTDLAPNAKFYVGELAYQREKFEDAITAFDAVVEGYPENNKTLDAMYMKGLALGKLDQRAEAAAQFRSLVKRAPTSEQAAKAKDQVKRLTPAAAAPARKKK
ncbi:MAG: outer membrane protein assembly factor BamD [Acidobacteria bacterium]|nr:outer membrane protein assembly factor BamD [Acidobacteriota bacterium]